MTRAKIVLVPFPFDDLSATKVRPALCLTEPIGRHRHVILAFISSQIPEKPMENEIIIKTNSFDFINTGLKKDSVIGLHRLVTLNTSIFQRELGILPAITMEQVTSRLVKILRSNQEKT
jgi:mRNA interferase MazF